jgi:thiol-disulfide isomerase/thioredoxin
MIMAKNVEVEEDPGDEKPTPNRFAKHPDKPIKLLKFGAEWCGHCVAMARSKVLEKLVARHSDVELIIVDVEKNEDSTSMADEYDVKGMPALFFEDKEGWILAETTGGQSEAQLEKLYQKAKAKLGS